MCCMVKKWIFPLLIGVCLINTSMAQENPILLFPKGAPGETIKLIEKADTDGGKTGGESVLRITNVSEPTITIYHAPDEVASGAAMIVCPGGGYNILAYDLEGDEVCEWLNNLGITAVLLKYRVPRREGLEKHAGRRIEHSLGDAAGEVAARTAVELHRDGRALLLGHVALGRGGLTVIAHGDIDPLRNVLSLDLGRPAADMERRVAVGDHKLVGHRLLRFVGQTGRPRRAAKHSRDSKDRERSNTRRRSIRRRYCMFRRTWPAPWRTSGIRSRKVAPHPTGRGCPART